MCPDPTPEPPPPPPIPAIIAGATVGGVFVVVVVCTVMRLTNRSTTLEESATQPPVAVEPGNTGVSNSNTNGGIEEDGTVHWSIREAFEILDRDQKKNLEKRLENVRR